MKKKMILLASVLVLAIIAAISVLVWPLSFSNVISEKGDMRILVVEINDMIKYDNGQVNEYTREFVFSPDSAEYSQIRRILSKYSYHRSFRTLFSSDQSILVSKDKDDRYYLDLFSGESVILTGQTNEIKVNNKIYSIGYTGNDTAFSMMDEMKSIFDASAPSWENNTGIFQRGLTYR